MTENDAGGAYPGQPGQLRVVIEPQERDHPPGLVSLPSPCARCDGIPHEVAVPLRDVLRRAGLQEPGCWRCQGIPAQILQPIQQLARQQAGALS